MPCLLDTNVLLDILTDDPAWGEWSARQFARAHAAGPLPLNPSIYAELAAHFLNPADLDHFLRPSVFKRLPLPYEAGFRASRAFLAYREAGGKRTSPLPDFYIGAHAETAGFTLVTRDVTRYRTYFPEVKLITPEN
ncbi:MAG: type II toxin-antitoxin system VapC family toxin [Opitutaceae bacterium]